MNPPVGPAVTSNSSSDSSTIERFRGILGVASKEVFSMMVGTEVVPAPNIPIVPAEVTGMVGLAGELRGVLSIRCNLRTATKIATQMLGGTASEASSQYSDAIGELSNMVAGNFKAKIDGLEDKCMLSVPTVVTGDNYQLRSLTVEERIELPFTFDAEPIWITLELHS